MNFNNLNENERKQMLCTLASLFLHDDNKQINYINIQKIINESGNEVDNNWIQLFSNSINNQNINSLLNIDSSNGFENSSSHIDDKEDDNETKDL